MDHLQKLTDQVRSYLLFILVLDNLLLIAAWWFGSQTYHLSAIPMLGILSVLALTATVVFALISTSYLVQPVRMLWQAILHMSPEVNIAAPKLEDAHLGRELVASLTMQVYQLASGTEASSSKRPSGASDLHANTIANLLPMPLLVLDKEQTVVFANTPAQEYLKLSEKELIGNNVYSVLDMSFQNEGTFDTWFNHVKGNAVTASNTWERVKLKLTDQTTTRLFDLAAHYSKANPQGLETLLVLFDHTERYSQDEQAMSFVALAVHELRTPLTLLRGYIEAFEEELGDGLSDETADFMRKMDASAQQLGSFVNNILNVARIEEDQLTLELHEEVWGDIVQAATRDMNMRAEVRGISIATEIAPNLPTVAVDRVSIYEVLSNLLDNAIKYSGNSKQIWVKSYMTQDGFVETTITDSGVGIPTSVIPNLFSKFYRNHRNRSQIGGTGLGLYLSKTIVGAHSGHIWVRSKEGEGTTFGFTLLPYAKLADEQKNQDNKDITRSAHGWIKNHSLYRR